MKKLKTITTAKATAKKTAKATKNTSTAIFQPKTEEGKAALAMMQSGKRIKLKLFLERARRMTTGKALAEVVQVQTEALKSGLLSTPKIKDAHE